MHPDDFSKWIGCDAAIEGVVCRVGSEPALAYDYEKLVQVFIKKGMDREEAVEWIDFNIANAWIGDDTPFILERFDEDQGGQAGHPVRTADPGKG